MVPPHLNELYHKQLDPKEIARRRESLSALSLAINAPRPTDKVDHGPSSTAPSSARSSRMSRPGTAPPTAYISGKTRRSESVQPKHGSDASAATMPRTKRNSECHTNACYLSSQCVFLNLRLLALFCMAKPAKLMVPTLVKVHPTEIIL